MSSTKLVRIQERLENEADSLIIGLSSLFHMHRIYYIRVGRELVFLHEIVLQSSMGYELMILSNNL